MKMIDKITKIITPKRFSIFMGIVFLVTLIPMIILGFYNHPSADDFSIGYAAYHTFSDSGNIFATIGTAIAHAFDDWLNWMGYFTSTFLMSLPPSVFGEFAYKFSTLILLTALCSSIWYLFRMIFSKALSADKYIVNAIVFIMLTGLIQCMPVSAAQESFYWYCGAANYILVASLAMWEMGLLISLYVDIKSQSPKKHLVKKIATVFLGFLIGGGNHLTALNTVLIAIIMWFVFLVTKSLKKKEVRSMILPTLGLLIGFALNVMAPGNSTRVAITEGMSPLKAVLVSLFYYFKYCINEWLTWPVIIMLVLLIPLMIRAVRKTNFEFKYPLIIVFLGYGLTSAMMTPSLFALANIEAGRLRALTYIMFILTLVISEAYVIGWAVKKSAFIKKDVNISDGSFGKNELLMIVSVLLFTLFAVGITAVPEPDYFISTEAMLEVAGGEAATYSAELNERYEKYMSGDKNIVVKPLSVHPKLIFFVDMEGENEEWISNAVRRYYRLESVKIDGEE